MMRKYALLKKSYKATARIPNLTSATSVYYRSQYFASTRSTEAVVIDMEFLKLIIGIRSVRHF